MPLYDFRCRACGKEFEALVRSQDPEPKCPACESRDLQQLLSTFALDTDERRWPPRSTRASARWPSARTPSSPTRNTGCTTTTEGRAGRDGAGLSPSPRFDHP